MSRPLHSAPLVMNQPTTRCRCGKILCLNEQDARRIIRRIEKRKGDVLGAVGLEGLVPRIKATVDFDKVLAAFKPTETTLTMEEPK